jgi:hypothetical protein
MSDFNVRADSVDVEQVMEQIRSRVREKRGVDYTEQQLRELAAVKLEKFLDPRGVRSDLLQRFKEQQPQYEPPVLPLYTFEDTTIFETHRGPLQWIRKLLLPILKLFFNPNPIIHVLHAQSEINRLNLEREAAQVKRRMEMESLYYEIIHNLVFELTRSGIEVKNLKMRVESLASRLEFNERRARALESVVVYRTAEDEPAESTAASLPQGSGDPTTLSPQVGSTPPSASEPSSLPGASHQALGEGPGQRSRRRRRRRGRRSGPPASTIMGPAAESVAEAAGDDALDAGPDEPSDASETAPSTGDSRRTDGPEPGSDEQ